VVRRFTRQDVVHMLGSIKDIEQAAARRACQRASDAEIAGVLRLSALGPLFGTWDVARLALG